MAMDTSEFSDFQHSFPDAELLSVGGSTCHCYRVRLYGKLHFMKRLKPEFATNPHYVAALQKEFETGYRLEHQHLVRYVAKGSDYLLTEYVDGETLGEFMTSHPDFFKSVSKVKRLLSQLCDVVSYLHQHQIVHLDLKPSNILITRINHDIKLVDLGYCYTDIYTDTMGHTDKYAAPEQLDGSAKVDSRTDIHAIGKILQTLPCASKYKKIIRRCTAFHPANRFQSVEELANSLETHNHHYWLWLLLLLLPLAVVLYYYQRQTPTIAPSTTSSKDSVTAKTDSIEVYTNSEPESQNEHQQQTTPLPPVASTAQRKETQSDTMKLRQELQRRIGPLYQQALGTYNDSAFNCINEPYYFRLEAEFAENIRPVYTEIWKKHQDQVSMHTMESEWNETIKYFHQNQILRMHRNMPNHDPFYNNLEYHYYDTSF